jgi:hypothetical protein
MKPIKFKESNVVLAEDQPGYLPLPVYRDKSQVISCWYATIRERIRFLFTGKLWLHILTFNTPLQPQLPRIDDPFRDREDSGKKKKEE